MKVVKSKSESVTFGELNGGDAFACDQGLGLRVYIKLFFPLRTCSVGDTRNAVCVEGGTSALIRADEVVTPLPNAVLYCNGRED